MNYLQTIKNRAVALWGHEPQSLDELAKCVIELINLYPSRTSEKVRVVGFKWDIHRGQVSNSHCQPINGVSNWGGDPKLPKSYMGWSGRVWIRYKKDFNTFGSDPFRNTLTYPGTGGFGCYNGPWTKLMAARYEKKASKSTEPQVYSWDYRFFEDDWPGILQDQLYKDMLFNAIKNPDTSVNMHHVFEWQDPEVVKSDREFLDNFK